MIDIQKLKSDYNSLLSREKKAEYYLDRATPKQFERWKPEFFKIVEELSTLIKTYERETGKKMTQDEILHGFGGNL